MSKKQIVEFTPRSKASVQREQALLRERGIMEGRLGYAQRQIAELKRNKAANLKHVSRGNVGMSHFALDQTLRELEDTERREKALVDFLAAKDREIEQERESPAGRAKIQAQLAALFGQRLEHDRDIAERVDQLRDSLIARADLTRRLSDLAGQIELAEDLDQERFDVFAAALPENLLLESERRANGLLGLPGEDAQTVIARNRFEYRESLRHAGIFEPGEEVLVCADDFAELTRANVRDPRAGSHGLPENAVIPQRCCCVTQYEKDVAEAAEKGIHVAETWHQQNHDRRGEEEQLWIRNRRAEVIEELADKLSHRVFPSIPMETARVLASQQVASDSINPFRVYSQVEIKVAASGKPV